MTHNTKTSIHHYDKPIGGTIENWEILFAGERFVCVGDLYGDPKEWYPDGYTITTSMLVHSELEASKIETLHTRYKLGKVKSNDK